jgi:hypothetical protein
VRFAAINLFVASQDVFVVVVYFVIDSVRKLLDTPSYIRPLSQLTFHQVLLVIKSRRVRWAGHVGRMGEMRCRHNFGRKI